MRFASGHSPSLPAFILAVVAAAAPGCSSDGSSTARRSIVRVVTPSGHGTGFFVKAPNGEVLVATAFHVVSDGTPITVERQVDVSDSAAYHVAYPETELAAYDPDADLALVRVKNVPADTFAPLALGQPRKDAAITSWGFPGSSLVDSLDLTRKEGKLSNLIRLNVEDHRTGEVLKENAIPGLIVSTALEPGFSGGPTLSSDQKVVGINVMKDREHAAQNACVNVSELSRLLAAPIDTHLPTPTEVRDQLLDLQKNFLQLGPDERERIREADVVAIGELPRLRSLVSVLFEADRSGQAGVAGIALARMPGQLLPTFTSSRIRAAVAECRTRADHLQEFLDSIGSGDSSEGDRCEELATRALITDLVAATLRWDGQERDIAVTRVEEVDAEHHLYRANVSFGGGSAVSIGLGWSSGRLRLRLFDQQGKLAAMQGTASPSLTAMAGGWEAASKVPGEDEYSLTESLNLGTIGDGEVTFVHKVTQRLRTNRPGKVFACNDSREVVIRLTQYFRGKIEGGDIVAVPVRDAEIDVPARCSSLRGYTADKLVRLKTVGGHLVMLRTSGSEWPEAQDFHRPAGA